MSWKNKVDKTSYGVIIGLILPFLAFLFFWSWRHGEKDFSQLWNFMRLSSANRNELLIFPLVPNLLLFYFSNFTFRLDKFTVGLVGTTLFLTIPVVIWLIL